MHDYMADLHNHNLAIGMILPAVTGLPPDRMRSNGDLGIEISSDGTISYNVRQRLDKKKRLTFSHRVYIRWPELAELIHTYYNDGFEWKGKSTQNRDKNQYTIFATANAIAANAGRHLEQAGMHPLHRRIINGNASFHFRAPLDYVASCDDPMVLKRVLASYAQKILPKQLISSTPLNVYFEKLNPRHIPTHSQINLLFDHYARDIYRVNQTYKVFGDIQTLVDLINKLDYYYLLSLLISAGGRPHRASFPYQFLDNERVVINDKDSNFREQRTQPHNIGSLIHERQKLRQEFTQCLPQRLQRKLTPYNPDEPTEIELIGGNMTIKKLGSLSIIHDLSSINKTEPFAPNATRHLFAQYMFKAISPTAYNSCLGHHVPQLNSEEKISQIRRQDIFDQQLSAIKSFQTVCGYKVIQL